MFIIDFLAMIEQNGEKIGSAISKHSDNIMGFGFWAKNIQKLAELKL